VTRNHNITIKILGSEKIMGKINEDEEPELPKE
jgi:hypothetical protein